MLSRSANVDFFAAQRRLRRRSRAHLAGLFVLLWLVVNWLLVGAHSERTCDAASVCETTSRFRPGVLVLAALVVAAYLGGASLLTSRATVSGRAVEAGDRTPYARLRNVVEEVAIASGVATPQVFVLDDPARNAYAVSDGRRNGAVVVTTGLLAVVDRRELAGVVAHEIAHIRNRDSRVLIVTVYAVGAVVVLAALATSAATGLWRALHHVRRRNLVVVFLIGMLAIGVTVLALPLRVLAVPAAELLKAALSRHREELADASAVQFTRDPGGLRRALEKIAGQRSEPRVNGIARALCIERADGQRGRGLLGRWMGSHPPIEERIAWLRSLEGGASGAPAAPLESVGTSATGPAPASRMHWRRRAMATPAAWALVGLFGIVVLAGIIGGDSDTDSGDMSTGAAREASGPLDDGAVVAPTTLTATLAGPLESEATTTIASHAAAATAAPATVPSVSVEYDLSSGATCAMRAAVRLGSSGDDVRCLQQRLGEVTRGADPIVADGEFGPMTEAAVRRLQAAHELTVDGIVGAQTARLLGIWDPGLPSAQPAVALPEGCHPSYPTACIPPPPPDLDCDDVPYRRFTVVPPDPHNFDGDGDGVGCER